MPPTRLPLCAVLVLVTSGGCSYLFVDGPPEKHRQLNYFQCSTSKAWPVVDTVVASVYGIDTVAFIAGASASKSDRSTFAGVAAVAAATTALFVASAYSGYHDVSECRQATEDLQIRLNRMQPGAGMAPPGAGPWQPQGPQPGYDPWVTRPAQPFGTPPTPPPSAPPGPQIPEEKR